MSPRFREVTTVVHAEQFFHGKDVDGVEGRDGHWFVRTPEGDVHVQPGDWVVTYPSPSNAPERYVLSAKVFKVCYEPVEE